MDDIKKISKRVENHEKRIQRLEELAKVKRGRISSKKKSVLDHVIDLKSEGFFDNPQTLSDIVHRLAEKSYHYPQTSLTEPLQRAVRQGVLGRLKRDGKWAYCKR